MAGRTSGRRAPTSQEKALANYDLNRNKKMYTGHALPGEKHDGPTGSHKMTTKEVWRNKKVETKSNRDAGIKNNE